MTKFLRDLMNSLGANDPLRRFINTMREDGYSEQEISDRVRDASRSTTWGGSYSIHPVTGERMPDNHPDFMPDEDDGYDN